MHDSKDKKIDLSIVMRIVLVVIETRDENGLTIVLKSLHFYEFSKTEGHKSKTGQPKTGESARTNPLDISKMVSVKKGKELDKRWTRSKPVNVLSALPPLTSITPSPLTSITIEPFAETVQESLGESISSGEKAGVDRIDESKPGRSITSALATRYKTWLDNRNLIINKLYLQALSGKVKPSPHNLGGVPMEAQ
jgi:hypothetical protein